MILLKVARPRAALKELRVSGDPVREYGEPSQGWKGESDVTIKRALPIALLALAALPWSSAQASVRIGIGIGFPGFYYRPYPYYYPGVVVAPSPVYVAPPPVYYQPAPVYVQPAPVYVQPQYAQPAPTSPPPPAPAAARPVPTYAPPAPPPPVP